MFWCLWILLFPDQATLLTFQINLRTILDSKPEKFKNIEARQNVRYSFKKGLYLL